MSYPYAAAAAAPSSASVDIGQMFSQMGIRSWSTAVSDNHVYLILETAADVDRLKAAIFHHVPRTCERELMAVRTRYSASPVCYANDARIEFEFASKFGADEFEIGAHARQDHGWTRRRLWDRVVEIHVEATGDGTDGFEHVEKVFNHIRPLLGAKMDSLRKIVAEPVSYQAAAPYSGGAPAPGQYPPPAQGGPVAYSGGGSASREYPYK